jgi:hypothetical protein
VHARGRHPTRNRWRLRIRLPRRHPRVVLDISGHRRCRQARKVEARGTGSLNAFRSQDGSVLGLGPFVYLTLRRGRRSSGQRRTSSPGWQASWVTRAPEASRRLHGGAGPEPSEAFCYGLPDGSSTASGRQRERRPVAEVARRLPHVWCLTEVSPGRKTRSGNTMTPPMGFVSFRREKTR